VGRAGRRAEGSLSAACASRCPGSTSRSKGRAYSLDEVVETIRRIVVAVSPDAKVSLLLHDWGCFFGYQFAMRHPQLVDRVIGVDIGDAGSGRHRAEMGRKSMLMVLAYQMWLALAWRIGGTHRYSDGALDGARDALPDGPAGIGAQMGYPYALRWLGVAGGLERPADLQPAGPMLYLYGERKPFMFHSRAWAERLAARPSSRVIGFPTGHWSWSPGRAEFNEALLAWLAETEAAARAG
jgi:pimeloyl-ACP methyl ester carboxylesterase